MTGSNHIAGGLVFTGVFASLWNVNIFATVEYLGFAVLGSLLPDIDHTKSWIGKAFYPVSKWLDRKFGHRTITHSFAFLFVITMLCASIERLFSENLYFTIILFFSVFSHFLLDMVTVQGIPLFYPFARNPCVIPENANYRIKTNNKKAEISAFVIFVLLLLSCVNLFENGFWTSYNRMFGTIKHVHQENRNTDKQVIVEYSYKKDNIDYTGEAFLINSTDNRCILFDQGIFILDKKDIFTQVVKLKPRKADKIKEVKEISFFNIQLDSLEKTLKNKVISGNIQASQRITQVNNNIKTTSNLIKLDFAYNPIFTIENDTSKEALRDKIEELQIKLGQEKNKYLEGREKAQRLTDSVIMTKKYIDNTDDIYIKNKLQKALISLKERIKRIEENRSIYKADAVKLYKIKELKEELEESDNVLFSGVLKQNIIPAKKKNKEVFN